MRVAYRNSRYRLTEAGEPIIAEGKCVVSSGGGQPNTGAPMVEGTFEIEGSVVLPE
jgi:beta-glucosidase